MMIGLFVQYGTKENTKIARMLELVYFINVSKKLKMIVENNGWVAHHHFLIVQRQKKL